MTTIAYAGNGHIAADSRCCAGELVMPVTFEKLLQVQHAGKRYLAGIAGAPGGAVELLKRHILRDSRLIAGLDPLFTASKSEDSTYASLIVVHLDAPTRPVYFVDGLGFAHDITGKPYALGSGRDYAMGAMAAGADAELAVAISARFDTGTGGVVKSLSIEAMSRSPLSNFVPLTAAGV